MVQRNGGQIVVDELARHGVRNLFMVPGESFLPILDALFDAPVPVPIVCRHEGAAAIMAESTGKLTGQPGVACVTRAPGAANALAGVVVAAEDESPMLLLVGLPRRADLGRSPFQAIDITAVFGSLAKRVETVMSAAGIAEAIRRGWSIATTGRPGPVVLGLPEDVLAEVSDVTPVTPVPLPRPLPTADELAALGGRLAKAERPLMIVGGHGWTAAAQAAAEAFAARFDVPVAASFRRQDYFDNDHPSFVGHLGLAIDDKLAAACRSADLVLAIGAPLGQIATGDWRLLTPARAASVLIHVRPAADAFDPVLRPALPIVADPVAIASALATLPVLNEPPPWSAWRRDLRRAYESWRRAGGNATREGRADLAACIAIASAERPPRSIVTNGAGNYAAFLHRHFVYRGYPGQLAPISGTMGYGLPAAIAARLAYPDRAAIAFAGDGCFQVTAMELATAMQHAVPIVVIVADNGMYGTIRMHQERRYPGRVVATSLVNPDFAAMAASFGAHAETVKSAADFKAAYRRALTCGGPAVVVIACDPDQLAPGVHHGAVPAEPNS